jgi:hypothetical protein
MTLEELKDRVLSLEASINQITQNLYMLHGHRAEVQYQISELEKAQNAVLEEQPEAEVVVQ